MYWHVVIHVGVIQADALALKCSMNWWCDWYHDQENWHKNAMHMIYIDAHKLTWYSCPNLLSLFLCMFLTCSAKYSISTTWSLSASNTSGSGNATIIILSQDFIMHLTNRERSRRTTRCKWLFIILHWAVHSCSHVVGRAYPITLTLSYKAKEHILLYICDIPGSTSYIPST